MITLIVILWVFSLIVTFFIGVYAGGVRMPGTIALMDDDQLGQLADQVQRARKDRMQ